MLREKIESSFKDTEECTPFAVPNNSVFDSQLSAWNKLSVLPVRRSNPLNGLLSTEDEFVGLFGTEDGRQFWTEARDSRYERRRAPNRTLYSYAEFEDFFRDNGSMWNRCRYDGFEEKRADVDGNYYTMAEFDTHYKDNGLMWSRALIQYGIATVVPTSCVYLLVAENGTNYIGSTVDLKRRIRQHTGVRNGGAMLTAKHDGWSLALYICGFDGYATARQFEMQWQNPETSFVLTPMQRSTPRKPLHLRKLEENLAVLKDMLTYYNRWCGNGHYLGRYRIVFGTETNHEMHLRPLDETELRLVDLAIYPDS